MTIQTEKKKSLLLVTLDRPDALNALNGPLIAALEEIIEQTSRDSDVRTFCLTGSGRAFCAGADLKERRQMSEEEVRKRLQTYRRVFRALEKLPCATIAAINGFALGGGLELALACDLRYAGHSAKIGLTELRLGIIPGAGGTQRLSRLVGASRAKELMFTGRRLSGQEAQAYGIVQESVEDERLLDRVYEIADEISLAAPIGIAEAKRAVDEGMEVDLEEGLAIEARAYEATIGSQDRIEGLRAFAEKRPPVWKGR